jgi:hypothetical protein
MKLMRWSCCLSPPNCSVFYAIHVVSVESGRLVLPTTSCAFFFYPHYLNSSPENLPLTYMYSWTMGNGYSPWNETLKQFHPRRRREKKNVQFVIRIVAPSGATASECSRKYSWFHHHWLTCVSSLFSCEVMIVPSLSGKRWGRVWFHIISRQLESISLPHSNTFQHD